VYSLQGIQELPDDGLLDQNMQRYIYIVECRAVAGSDLETDSKIFAAGQQIFNKHQQMAVAREQLSKHVPAETDTHITIDELLETVFSTGFVQRGYITRTPAWGQNTRGSNLAAVKLTTVQVTKLPL
jgi:hypothetical protein